MTKLKWIQVTFSNGETWEIPASVVAEDRTSYYTKKDGLSPADSNAEYRQSMEDYELIDWACNNMNWEDVEGYAKLIRRQAPNRHLEWVNADKKVAVHE